MPACVCCIQAVGRGISLFFFGSAAVFWGVRAPFVPSNTDSFLLVSGLCSPHGESMFKDLLGTAGRQ